MTPKEAFKVGFLHKCAADGLTKEETLERARNMRMAKVAFFGAAANAAGGAAATLGTGAWKGLLTALLLGPPIAGLAGGYGLAQAKDQTYSKDDAKKRELLAAYERAASQLERSRSKRMTQL
jgi:hypothetical protein